MKGLILTYVVTYASAFASLRYPLVGLYVYVAFAVLRPQFIFGWAGDISGVSLVVGVAALIGWVFRGFGTWTFGRSRGVLVCFVLFFAWFCLSAAMALNTAQSWDSVVTLSKIALPLLVGATMIDSEKEWRPLLWTLVICQGYVGFEQNLNYVKGFNTAAEGFGGMDNNFFGLSLVTMIGPAIALTMASRTWIERGIAGACVAAILHTTMLTFSRGALLGLLAVGFTAFIMMPKRPKYLAGLVAVAVLAVTLTGPQLAERYGTAFVGSSDRDESSQSRIDLWKDCVIIIEQYPIFGVGPANWRTIAARFGWPEGKSAHSVWLESAAELGIPGATLLLTFFLLAAIKMWPMARAKQTEANRYEIAVASGVVLSIVGFVVSGSFVSAPALEVPYYITMLGIGVMRSERLKVMQAAASEQHPLIDPGRFPYSLPGPGVGYRTGAPVTAHDWTRRQA